jgi:hypothetical protein
LNNRPLNDKKALKINERLITRSNDFEAKKELELLIDDFLFVKI